MNLNNTPESHEPNETLPQETLDEASDIPSENCFCDADAVCDSCSVKNSDIKEITSKKDKAMCRHKSQKKKKIIDTLTDQNHGTDLHVREECTNERTTELCLSEEKLSSVDNEENEKGHKNISSRSPSDCTLEESTDSPPMETCEHSNIIDSRRTRRSSKRKRDVEDFCPVCGVTVRYSELENHYAKEVENLSKISKSIRKTRTEENQGVSTTFVQVKTNRENRHAAKVAKFSTRPRNEVHCPVCDLRLAGTQDEINSHVLNCINEEETDEEINVIDHDEDSFEEYEFADQTRVRAISLVPGGYRSLQGNFAKLKRNDDDDEDLNVDVDDTMAYGSPQYTELDVIHNNTDDREKEQLEQLRKAVLLDPYAERHVLESRKWGNSVVGHVNSEDSSSLLDKSRTEAIGNQEDSEIKKTENTEDQESCGNEAANQIVSSLKEKIRDLEEQNKSVKCLICLEPYTKPVVSTTCWHVHCEECWLMTMGVKKLCPQCNMIVFPSDLRRIYL